MQNVTHYKHLKVDVIENWKQFKCISLRLFEVFASKYHKSLKGITTPRSNNIDADRQLIRLTGIILRRAFYHGNPFVAGKKTSVLLKI